MRHVEVELSEPSYCQSVGIPVNHTQAPNTLIHLVFVTCTDLAIHYSTTQQNTSVMQLALLLSTDTASTHTASGFRGERHPDCGEAPQVTLDQAYPEKKVNRFQANYPATECGIESGRHFLLAPAFSNEPRDRLDLTYGPSW